MTTFQEQDCEEEKVHEFLFGLNENYHTVRSSLVSLTPLQPLEEVYDIVQQEEDLKGSVQSIEESPEVTAYTVHTRGRINQVRIDNHLKMVLCKHCN